MADTLSKFHVERVEHGYSEDGRKVLVVIRNYGEISSTCRIKAIKFFLENPENGDEWTDIPYHFHHFLGNSAALIERTWCRRLFRVTLIEKQVEYGKVFTYHPKWNIL
jgi:hypothetical protein